MAGSKSERPKLYGSDCRLFLRLAGSWHYLMTTLTAHHLEATGHLKAADRWTNRISHAPVNNNLPKTCTRSWQADF